MDLSVEISTYNRKDTLRLVLASLARQTLPFDRFEVVVSDDGSNDGLVEFAQRFAHELPYSLRVIANERRGVGHNHNQGILACSADLVLMLAADIIAEPTLLEQHVATHRAHPDPTVVVAGLIRQSPNLPTTAFQQAFGQIVEGVFAHHGKQPHVANFLVSNLSFKREFMLCHGMFLEWPLAAGEDIELGYRLKDAGMTLIENPQALGYHYHVVTWESVAFRAYSSGYYSYLLRQHVRDREFLRTFGHPTREDGFPVYVRGKLKDIVRRIILNRATVPMIIVPSIHLAERARFLMPILPGLCRRMTSYYFHQGARDHARGVPFDSFRARVYSTDPT
jgi:glycosyltransferase involved in cell wall biosynthesis